MRQPSMIEAWFSSSEISAVPLTAMVGMSPVFALQHDTNVSELCMPKKAATPWGPADLVEELKIPQRAGQRHFASLVQLLETDKGERLVRFAHTTDGTTRRGPVTLKLRDLERLRAALAEHPGLAEAILGGGA